MKESDDEYEESPNSPPPSNSTPHHEGPSKKKCKREAGKSRFRWTPEMVDTLIDCLNDEKSKQEFNRLDFEADLVALYSNIRVTMAGIFESGEFGVIEVKEIAEGLETKDLALEKVRYETEKKEIRNGYERIKTKAKEIRQNYRKAVGEGRRSGSGRIVCDNWDKLKAIWGGSPATTSIENSISSISMENDDIDRGFDDWEFSDKDEGEDGDMSDGVCNEVSVTTQSTEENMVPTDANQSSSSGVTKRKEAPAVNKTPKFVDNKRKNMEKGLSANQRDKVYMK